MEKKIKPFGKKPKMGYMLPQRVAKCYGIPLELLLEMKQSGVVKSDGEALLMRDVREEVPKKGVLLKQKRCTKCGKMKSVLDFPPFRDGVASGCCSCYREYHRIEKDIIPGKANESTPKACPIPNDLSITIGGEVYESARMHIRKNGLANNLTFTGFLWARLQHSDKVVALQKDGTIIQYCPASTFANILRDYQQAKANGFDY